MTNKQDAMIANVFLYQCTHTIDIIDAIYIGVYARLHDSKYLTKIDDLIAKGLSLHLRRSVVNALSNDDCTEYGHHHAAHVGRGDGVLEQQQGHGDHGYPLGHNITLLVSNKFSYENKIYI